LVQIVNAPENTINRIDLRYLKKDHNHMSADTVHASIESKIRHTKVACSFQSLNELIFQARGKNKILKMCFGDSDCGCQEETRKKMPCNLPDIVQVSFVRGKQTMTVKTDLDEPPQK